MWIPAYSELKDNPKLITLCDQLDISEPEGIGYLVYLWWFTGTYAEDGNLSKFSATHIEKYCQWRGEKRKLFTAFIEARFIEKIKDGLFIKDWQEHTGKFIEKSKKHKERMKIYREKSDNGDITVSEQKNNVSAQIDNRESTVSAQIDNRESTVSAQIDNRESYVRCNHTNHTNSTIPTFIDDVIITRTREGEAEEEKAVKEISNYLFTLTGRSASASDYVSITEIVNSPEAPESLPCRVSLIKSTMAAVAAQKKNKDPANGKINSFSYFKNPILSEFQKIKAKKERGIKTSGTGEKDNRTSTGGLKSFEEMCARDGIDISDISN
jgi:hypothetical protein